MQDRESPTGPLYPRRGYDVESIKVGFSNHLKYTLAKDRYTATDHDRYLALASTVRDRLIERWIETQQTHHDLRVKRVYYLSLEFLMGRALTNNLINIGLIDPTLEALESLGLDWESLVEEERDAGLGNGGLGRLAACFLDSMATMHIPAMGYGLRYDYGIFRQRIDNGWQVEEPDDWLRQGNPWETRRPEYRFSVHFGGTVESVTTGGETDYRWVDTRPVIGVPFDTPVVGYGGATVNNLRLWSARAAEEFDFEDFDHGDYIAAVESKVTAENITKVLYPNDNIYAGKELRLKQQYFFVSCSLQDILRRFRKHHDDWNLLPDRAAIQLNDTHPSLAIPELMRLLIDIEDLPWDAAWDITVRCMGYTNHTLLPEALEKWPVEMLKHLLPRHLQIIYEINRRFMEKVSVRFPGDADRQRRMSIIEEGPRPQARMAHLSIVGSHSTNGVARLHTELLKERVVPDFHEMFPERFNSKTNGITQRRWLLRANPPLASLITGTIGNMWVRDLTKLRELAPLADDAGFRAKFGDVKRQAKVALAGYMKAEYGWEPDPDSIFDVQVKRLHEYKRQLMNAIHIVSLYRRLIEDPGAELFPRTFFFGAKAAPGYREAKLVIKLINNIARVINADPATGGRLKVFFLPDYRVSLAERVIPAADISEQISLAGTEASGTGNMKFMLNGALTIGTLDGANIEMRDEVGDENIFIFGMTAAEVAERRPAYDPVERYKSDAETRRTLDFLFSGRFSEGEAGVFDPIRRMLLDEGDRYMVLEDLPSYTEAQRRAEALYRDRDEWLRKAVLNTACSGKFSSDRTIAEYAAEIWNVKPCPIKFGRRETLPATS